MTIIEATRNFETADKAWRAKVVRVFGRNNNAAYEKRGRGDAGSELRHLHEWREDARRAYEATSAKQG